MTYNTPELHLVGAAQSLVLATCDLADSQVDPLNEYISCTEDNTNPVDQEVEFI